MLSGGAASPLDDASIDPFAGATGASAPPHATASSETAATSATDVRAGPRELPQEMQWLGVRRRRDGRERSTLLG
jgi:hypothetical protein